MKKYIRFVILSAFLLTAILPRTALADEITTVDEQTPETTPDEQTPGTEPDEQTPETTPDEQTPETKPMDVTTPRGSGSVEKIASKSAVKISLNVPEDITEKITAVHMYVQVKLENGSLKEAPSFASSQLLTDKGAVIVSDILQQLDGNYIAELILTDIQDLFPSEGAVELGTLSLTPDVSKSDFQAQVGFISTRLTGSGDKNPHVDYTLKSDGTSISIPLATANRVTVTEEMPAPPQQAFNKPVMTVKLGGSNKNLITFQWEQAKSADGYRIFQYDDTTKKFIRIKTIKDGGQTTYEKTFSYAADYQFRLRAFKTTADGNRTFGKYGPIVKITTAPAAPKNFRAVYTDDTGTQISLTWEASEGADGYRIYRSDTVDGTYKFLKAVKNGTSLTDTQPKGTYHYYKIRAFRDDTDKKHVYGAYAAKKAVWLSATKATARSGNRSKKVIVKWTKIPLADGYGIYQYDKEKKQYSLAMEVAGGDTTKATLTLDFDSTYKFVVRGRQIQYGIKVFGKASPAVTASTAPGRVSLKSVNAASPGSVVIKWNKISTADKYQIARSTSKDGTCQSLGMVSKDEALQFTDNTVVSGNTYYYTVRAYRETAQGTLVGIFSPRVSVKAR